MCSLVWCRNPAGRLFAACAEDSIPAHQSGRQKQAWYHIHEVDRGPYARHGALNIGT